MLDFVSVSVFCTALAGVALYITLKYLRIKLREPRKGQFEAVALAYHSSARIPPPFQTPQLRRQLVLSSARPAELTNVQEMRASALDLRANRKKPVIYGFLHPKAAAGGGGERVLWAAIKQLVASDSHAVAAVYVDLPKGMTPSLLLQQAKVRFHIEFSEQEAGRIVVIALTQAWLVDPATYLMLTLLSQAVGMAVLGYEAVANLMPDVLVDTTGLAFSYPVIRWFAQIPIVAYVHYPFVQSRMRQSIRAQGLAHPKRLAKYVYYQLLTKAYNWAGSFASVVATNSTWTKQHLEWPQAHAATIVYPPSAVQDFPAPEASDPPRTPAVVYLAQFRPEKRHDLVITAFAKMLTLAKSDPQISKPHRQPHLIFLGSVRDEADALYVHQLKQLAKSVALSEKNITFVENAPWSAVARILRSSLVGVNAMWNEHFGMGVVENMAAGLIPVVHASAGPLLDIVKDSEGAPGFFFRSKRDPDGLGLQGYPTLSGALLEALRLPPAAEARYRQRAYQASLRFSDAAFAEGWQKQIEEASALIPEFRLRRERAKLFD